MHISWGILLYIWCYNTVADENWDCFRALSQYAITWEVKMITQYLLQILVYHVEFKVYLVFNPPCSCILQLRELCLLLQFFKKMYDKTIVKFGFRMILWIIKPRVCVICQSRRLRQITWTFILIIHDTMLNLVQLLLINFIGIFLFA